MSEVAERRVGAPVGPWQPTPKLRWFRPKGGTDNDLVLQQLHWRPLSNGGCGMYPEEEWLDVETVLAD